MPGRHRGRRPGGRRRHAGRRSPSRPPALRSRRGRRRGSAAPPRVWQRAWPGWTRRLPARPVDAVPDQVAATVTRAATAAAAAADSPQAARRRRRDVTGRPAGYGASPTWVGASSCAAGEPDGSSPGAAGPVRAPPGPPLRARSGPAVSRMPSRSTGAGRRRSGRPAWRPPRPPWAGPRARARSSPPAAPPHWPPSAAGTSGWRVSRTTAVSIPTPGKAGPPVRHSSSTRPRA